MISDIKNGITNIQWTSYDKVKQVTFDAAHASKILTYEYNSQQLRLTKNVQFPATGNNNTTPTYIYDGSGLLMATYDYYYNS